MIQKPYEILFSRNALEKLHTFSSRTLKKLLQTLAMMESDSSPTSLLKKLEDDSLGAYKLSVRDAEAYIDISPAAKILVLEIKQTKLPRSMYMMRKMLRSRR